MGPKVSFSVRVFMVMRLRCRPRGTRGQVPIIPCFYHSPRVMSVFSTLALHLPDDHATDDLARRLAPLLNGAAGTAPPGGRIHLSGDLGAGKTAFVRALLRESGIKGRIKSPSYALLESYKVSNLYFY